MRRVLKIRRAIPSEGGVPVTAWGGGIEPIARGGQIGQKDGRGGADSGGRVLQTEATWKPGSRAVSRQRCNICRVERREI